MFNVLDSVHWNIVCSTRWGATCDLSFNYWIRPKVGELSGPWTLGQQLGLACVSRVDTRITFWNSREKRDSLFRPKILARFSRDSQVKISSETRFSRVLQTEFCSETCENWVLLWNFVAGIASYESRRTKFCSKTRFLRVLQTNFVARLASLTNRNFIARLVRIITNFNPGVLREFWV